MFPGLGPPCEGVPCSSSQPLPTFYPDEDVNLAALEFLTQIRFVVSQFLSYRSEKIRYQHCRLQDMFTYRNVYPGISPDCFLQQLVRKSLESKIPLDRFL